MKIFIRLALLALLCVTLCEKTRHHNKKRVQFNLGKAGLKSREVTVTTNIIKKTQAFLDKQKEEAQKADEVHTEAPAGRWEDSEALLSTGELSVRIVQKGVEDDNMSVFAKLQYKLSEKMLFFLSVNDDYRGVQYGLNLLEVPIKSDKLKIGDCCGRIQPQVQHVEIELYSFKGYCFKIDMAQQNWLLCDEDMKTLNTFKDLLVRSVINAWYKINMPGLAPPTGVSANDCTQLPFDWSAGAQSMWPCKCAKASSMKQSPVAIDEQFTQDRIEETIMNLNLGSTYSLRYGIVIQEPEFHGELGTFSYITVQDKQVYKIFKFVFKIGKPEHPITNGGVEVNQILAEMQVHGRDQKGSYGILAIQFKQGRENAFVDSLNMNYWDFTNSLGSSEGDGLICLKPRLKYINWGSPFPFAMEKVLNGEKSNTNSFFSYSGSLTKPPCSEQVNWHVMQNPSEMSAQQFSDLKTYGLDRAKISPNNIRSIQKMHDRKVYFQQAQACPPIPPQRVEPPNLDYKYIHVKHSKLITGMAGKDSIIKSVFEQQSDTSPNNEDLITLSDDLKLNQLFAEKDHNPPKVIPVDVQQILIKKFLASAGQMKQEDKDTLSKAQPEQ